MITFYESIESDFCIAIVKHIRVCNFSFLIFPWQVMIASRRKSALLSLVFSWTWFSAAFLFWKQGKRSKVSEIYLPERRELKLVLWNRHHIYIRFGSVERGRLAKEENNTFEMDLGVSE